jgi:hypothetical protein
LSRIGSVALKARFDDVTSPAVAASRSKNGSVNIIENNAVIHRKIQLKSLFQMETVST